MRLWWDHGTGKSTQTLPREAIAGSILIICRDNLVKIPNEAAALREHRPQQRIEDGQAAKRGRAAMAGPWSRGARAVGEDDRADAGA